MRRAALIIAALLAIIGLSAGPANAAAGWGDSTQGQQTYYITDDTGTVQIVKIVIAVQYFSATDNTNLNSVSAAKVRCSVRNLDPSRVSGVRVDDCALGFASGLTLRTCEAGQCPALDGGGCCANAYSGFRYVAYVPGDTALLGRGTISYRGKVSGTLYTANWRSNPTSQGWYLT